MLSRSKGRHKITFQQLPLSLNPKVIKHLIIGIGLITSVAALLMILGFAGLKPIILFSESDSLGQTQVYCPSGG